jgi:hypothetical protein
VKSISKIKDSFREQSPVQEPVKSPVTLTSKRIDSIRKDPKVIEEITTNVQRLKILQEIKKQTKKLNDLNKTIEDKVNQAASSGDVIIDAAKKRADLITTEAERKRGTAETLLSKAVALEKTLDTKGKELKDLEDKILGDGREVNTKKLDLANRTIVVAQQETKAQKDLKEAIDLVKRITGLFLAAMETAEAVDTIGSQILDNYYKKADEIGKMYAEVQKLQAIVESGHKYNETRSKELDDQAILIKDRQETLIRSEKEIRRKLKT